jgi:uncharacterized repeat protein (TIGR03847 family)
MEDANAEFTHVTSLRSEAIGEPGQRTFRILVEGPGGSAIIWLEKEQLFQLALAARQLLTILPEERESAGKPADEGESPPATHPEFRARSMVLGHDGASGRFVIDARDEDSSEQDPPSVRIWSERADIADFAEEALRICGEGRPICPLCGGPIDSTGHACPRSNGHQDIGLKDI